MGTEALIERLENPGNLHSGWREAMREAAAALKAAEAEREKLEELETLFDLQWEADRRAVKRWQEAHPGNERVWPDRADMVVWLMEQLP